jgi:hypothetical protein
MRIADCWARNVLPKRARDPELAGLPQLFPAAYEAGDRGGV